METESYSTEELICILERERLACLRGERLKLTTTIGPVNPVVAPFLNTEAIQKFTAYVDFRATIHHYQQEHQVSGLIWRQVTVRGQHLQFPEVHDQLIPLPNDLVLLRSHKPLILKFWQNVIEGTELFLSVNRYGKFRPIALTEVEAIARQAEWASLAKYEYGDRLEVMLLLGWGNPREALEQPATSVSGSKVIHAVPVGQQPSPHSW